MDKADTKRQSLRPSTAEKTALDNAIRLEQEQINTALQIMDMIGQIRQVGICHETADGLTPKEEAAYAAALNRLELFMDQR